MSINFYQHLKLSWQWIKKIEFKGGARFLTYTDEEEKEHLDYSSASIKFADMQDSGYNRRTLKNRY